jgi:hypothetical protein
VAVKEPFEIPVGMRKVCWRFDRWRKGHKARLPIPEALWAAAAAAAGRKTDVSNYEQAESCKLAGTSPCITNGDVWTDGLV